MSCLATRNPRCIGLDLSHTSVRLMVQNTGARGVVASNLNLPFPDGIADRIISDGVIHHTINPFGAFAECCRVLKPRGLMYLAVYKPGGHYQALYRFPGTLIRSWLRYGIGRLFVLSTMMPLYYFVRLAKSRGKTSWRGARNLFYDYFVSPVVEFLSSDKIELWSLTCGAEIVNYNLNPTLNVHSFLLRRVAQSSQLPSDRVGQDKTCAESAA